MIKIVDVIMIFILLIIVLKIFYARMQHKNKKCEKCPYYNKCNENLIIK